MIIDIVLVYAVGRGGLEDVITTVSQGLVNRGHRVRVIQSYPSKNLDWENTLPEHYYYGMKNNINNETIQSLSLGYERLLQKIGKPDIVLATHAPSLSFICRSAIASVPGKMCPIISWLHAPPEYFGNTDLLRYSDAHLAISSQIGKSIKKNIYLDNPILNIGNPVKVRDTEPIRRSKDKLELIFIGRIHQHDKRLDILLRGLANLEGDWRLRLIGDGPDRDLMRDLSIELGIDSKLKWLGWMDNPWENVEEASLLVLSSDYEGFGLVLVEALSRGIPVVSTSCSGPLDIVEHGINGWLYPIGDSKELEVILSDIIKGKRILPSTETCINSVQRFDTEEVINNVEMVLNYYTNGEGSNNSENNYLAKDNYFQFTTSVKNILRNTIKGVEYLGTTHKLLNKNLLREYFTLNFLDAIEKDLSHPNSDENIEAMVCYPKLEFINYQFTRAKVRFILANKGISNHVSVNERLNYSAKIVNELGIWKIDGLSLLDEESPARIIYNEKVKKKILLVKTNNSGSNTLALFKDIPEVIKNNFDIELVTQNTSENYQYKVKNADILVLTEANVTIRKKYANTNQIIIELWHGFPLKSMGYADKNEDNLNLISDRWNQIDYMISYSQLYNNLMFRCLHMDPDLFHITGMPRNDLLLNSDNKVEGFNKLYSMDLSNKKIAFYMPTYRQVMYSGRVDTSLSRKNIFGLPDFDYEEFNQFLKINGIELFIKLHPIEERLYQEQQIDSFEHIHIITDASLSENNLDLYEILGISDILITDYSSVYFDYLLKNKPIIFIPIDKQEYSENRGFILSDFEVWTPGPKIFNQQALQNNMIKNLDNPDLYKNERERICNQVHYYKEAGSSKRVWKLIQDISNGTKIVN
ncbi:MULTISPECIES: CDP-glycerol glycerophosphotransferase family protein [Bacillaceae]|uniref:CDP-glycerol glycerophosphotransferase family protein n=1 Tax=Bacillaceae TaxID=186817 RepID=UPI001F443241|nr:MULTISPECIES: CDP-glycerol glycerophosphotransferase family protein [Bacillaceae]MCF2649508.1 CDP-glycerol glycerophosphotransferase family protein [Niallia circulans]CAI9385716.1 D-inositol-3-phosphate glycosyltransferase [Bacillus sp. T2.9-1]